MNRKLIGSALTGLLLLAGQASAGSVEECYQNLCASITIPDFLELGKPFDLQVNGRLLDGSRPLTAFQVLQDVQWSYTSSHVVRFDPPATRENLIDYSSFNSGPVNETYSPTAEPGKTFTFVFGLAGHGKYQVAIEASIAVPNQAEPIAVDIKPGSCKNPLNAGQRGVLPVALLGSTKLDVTTIDPASVRLIGVAPLRDSLEDVSTVAIDSEDNSVALCNSGSDGQTDLTLKFDAQEIVAAITAAVAPRALSDGQIVSLPLVASKHNSTAKDFEGSDQLQILLKKPKH